MVAFQGLETGLGAGFLAWERPRNQLSRCLETTADQTPCRARPCLGDDSGPDPRPGFDSGPDPGVLGLPDSEGIDGTGLPC